MRFSYSLTTRATPEQVFTTFTDFSERRLDGWRKTLGPGVSIWVLLRYAREAPGTVRWTLLDSDHCDGGHGEVRISPVQGGGSRVDAVIDHRGGRGLRGLAILLVQLVIGGTRGDLRLADRWHRAGPCPAFSPAPAGTAGCASPACAPG